MMEPIAKRLKQSAEHAIPRGRATKHEDDLEERIRRLESELQQRGSDQEERSIESEDDSSDSDTDSDSDEDDDEHDDKQAVVNLSAFANERVESLPAHLLPKAGASASVSSGAKRKSANRMKQAKPLLEEITWTKKVPFACKPCGFVGKDLDDFQQHRKTAEHLAMNQSSQEALVCQLCDKAFTSPHQLEEHRKGKWHLQRVQGRKRRHAVQVCYDFMRGTCRRGDNCAFSHATTKAMKTGKALSSTKKRVCEEFARASKCRFGDKCLFSHSINS